MSNPPITKLISDLVVHGVKTFVLCPGSRNAAIIEIIHNFKKSIPELSIYNHFEEREAAFFALGLIKLHATPVAVVTTSGTAASELLPATIEAYYSGLPLVLITADRPLRFRGTGAPQSIEQNGLFGVYAKETVEIKDDFTFKVNLQGPSHFNVPVEDGDQGQRASPNICDTTIKLSMRDINLALSQAQRPCAIVGELSKEERDATISFLSRAKLPYFAEAISGIVTTDPCSPFAIKSSDRILSCLNPDMILRIGGVPTAGFWRDLERTGHENVWSVSGKPFSGIPGGHIIVGNLKDIFCQSAEFELKEGHLETVRQLDSFLDKKLDGLFESYPNSEPALIRKIASLTEGDIRVYLGNSLPIRQWDLATRRKPMHREVFANRGANGIDGQISTLLGLATDGHPTLGILGDLTTLYGFSAPWIAKKLSKLKVCLVVINNFGGRIFDRVPSLKFALQNQETGETISSPHSLNFSSWAATWGFNYKMAHEVNSLDFTAGVSVVELVPDFNQTAAFWSEWDGCIN